MPGDLQPATWNGPFNGELLDELICPGETHLVTSEDVKSAWWLPVEGDAPAEQAAPPTSPKSSKSDPSPPSPEGGDA